MKENPRIVPKKFPFNANDLPEMEKAIQYLTTWKTRIDQRLFREGYEMRAGKLYEIGGTEPIDAETYWRKHGEGGLPGQR